MMKPITALDIFRNLPRTNCKDCGVPTCLAFASKVFSGERLIRECPHAGSELAERLIDLRGGQEWSDQKARDDLLAKLKDEMRSLVLHEAIERVSGWMAGDRLALYCMGKVFEIDAQGQLHSDCHINTWIHAPLLDHLVHSAGAKATNEWLAFYELDGSRKWARFFEHRCEQGMFALANRDPDLFLDALGLFGISPDEDTAQKIAPSADETILLHPFPLLPVAISYWRQDDRFEPRLTFRFDRACGKNLSCGSIYTICQGIVEMLKRITNRHSHGNAKSFTSGAKSD